MYPYINNTNDFSHIKNSDIDEILRGEISAIEAYEQVMKKVDSDPEVYRLKEFKSDHEKAVDYWKQQARFLGKIPENTSSVWGTVVETFVGTSKLIGEKSALNALKKGEEHGLSNYEKMLKSDKLTSFQKNEVRNTFIPRQKKHIESINSIMKTQ